MNDFEREWQKQLAAEKKYIDERAKRGDSRLNGLLQARVPNKLKYTLDEGFARAFELIFARVRQSLRRPITAATSSAAAACGA